jgi:hypothetical protein
LVLGVQQSGEPVGRLQAERDRQRLLQEGSPGHQRAAVPIGELGGEVGQPMQLVEHEAGGAVRDERLGRVEDVLAGGAEVDERAGGLGHGVDQRRHERDHGVAARPPGAAQRVHVEPIRAARRIDGGGSVGGDEADGGLRARQRGLRVEHGLQPGGVARGVEERVRDDERREEGAHQRKKTVSRSPARWMSKRNPSSTGSATSVDRRASSIEASTGSAALASCSSGK